MLTICLVFQGHVLSEQLRKDNTPLTKLFKSKERVVLKAKKLYARILHQKSVTGYLDLPMPVTGEATPWAPPPGPGKEGEKGSGIKQRQSKEEKLILLNMIPKYKTPHKLRISPAVSLNDSIPCPFSITRNYPLPALNLV